MICECVLLAAVAMARDMERMKRAFEDVNKEGSGSSTWSHDSGSDSWGHTKSQLSQVAGKLSAVADRSHHQVSVVDGKDWRMWVVVRQASVLCGAIGLATLIQAIGPV